MTAIACLLTGRERAAIATIALQGTLATKIIGENFRPANSCAIAVGEVRYGMWQGVSRNNKAETHGESVVVALLSLAKQLGATVLLSEQLGTTVLQCAWEIHCHGGEAAARRILDDLAATGATIVAPKDWQAACGIDELQRESITALTHTVTVRTAAVVLDQVRGALRTFVTQSFAELELGNVAAITSIHAQAKSILKFSNFGRHLTKPWNVVLAGAPNVGKSSLINALVGYQRSITMDLPGTTRDVLQADAVIDGWPISLCDTAGIRHDAKDEIELQGIDRALKILHEADLVVWVHDATSGRVTDALFKTDWQTRTLHVLNKVDLANPIAWEGTTTAVIRTSATAGIGMKELRESIVQSLIPELPLDGAAVPLCDRQVVAIQRVLDATEFEVLQDALHSLIGD